MIQSISGERRSSKWRDHPKHAIIIGTLAILTAIVVTVIIVLFHPSDILIERLSSLGYVGVFLMMFVSYSTVIFPVPGIGAVIATGSFLNPGLVGVMAGLGGALGELTGYLVGFGAREFINMDRIGAYRKVRSWVKDKGWLAIFFLSAFPNPTFDLVGITAGALRFPILKFFLIVWLGNTLKCIALAYAANWLGQTVIQWLS